MDPDATLAMIRGLVNNPPDPDEGDFVAYSEDLAASIRDLDEWMTRRGRLPAAWD